MFKFKLSLVIVLVSMLLLVVCSCAAVNSETQLGLESTKHEEPYMSATSEDVGEEGIELYNTKIRNINVLENLLNLQQCDTETQDNILNGMDTSVFEDYALYIDDGDEDTLPTYIFMGLASEDMSDEVQEELSSSVLSSLQNLTMVSGNNIPTSVCTTVRYVFVTASPECIDIGNKFTYMIGNIVDISSAEDMLNILTQSAS